MKMTGGKCQKGLDTRILSCPSMADVLGHLRILIWTWVLLGKPELRISSFPSEQADMRKMPKGTGFSDFKLRES